MSANITTTGEGPAPVPTFNNVEHRRPHASAKDTFPPVHRALSSPTPLRNRTQTQTFDSAFETPTLGSTSAFEEDMESSTNPDTRSCTRTSGFSPSLATANSASLTHPFPISPEQSTSTSPSFTSLQRQLTYSSLPPSPTNPDSESEEDRATFHNVGTSISLRSLPGRREREEAALAFENGSGWLMKNRRKEVGAVEMKEGEMGVTASRTPGRRVEVEVEDETDGEEGLSADEIDGVSDPTQRFRGPQTGEAGPSGWQDDIHIDDQTEYFPILSPPHRQNQHLTPFHKQLHKLPSSSTDPNLARHALESDRDNAEERDERSLRAVSLPPDEELEDVHDQIHTKGRLPRPDRDPDSSGKSEAQRHVPLASRTPSKQTIDHTPIQPSRRLTPSPALNMLRTQSVGMLGSPLGGRPMRGRAHSHAHAHPHASTTGRSFRRDGAMPQISARQSYRETVRDLSVDTSRSVTPQPEVSGLEDDNEDGVDVSLEVTGEVAVGRKSIWGLLKDEMEAEDGDHQEGFSVDGKWDRIANFLAIPLAVEKNVWFGSMLCLDSFLFQFTILPIRALFATISILVDWISNRRFSTPPLSHLRSLLRMSLVVIPTGILLMTTDASRMYHLVRGQDTIKLYVIFGAVEVADKLCCAFGQDILDTLFARETLDPALWPGSSPTEDRFPESPGLAKARIRKRERARPVFFWLLAVAYIHVHSLVLFYQLVCLNVAINSYDNALLTLLVSNQFTEIKGSVFKKFEKDNLFQILCADIVERYQLGLMLGVIAVRNLIEMAGSDLAFLPKSFIRGKGALETILSPALVVIMSEMITDWLKHAFITKFNHVRASVYERYTDVLCKDILLAGGARQSTSLGTRRRRSLFVDQSPLVTRRLGLATLPLCCLVIRVGFQGLGMLLGQNAQDPDILVEKPYPVTSSTLMGEQALRWTGILLVLLIGWLLILAIKLLLGLNLLAYAAHREQGMNGRERHDAVNDFGRLPLSESKAERIYAKDVSAYLSSAMDGMPKPRPLAAHPPVIIEDDREAKLGGKSQKPKNRLEDIERWTMVKRIF